MVTNIPKYSKPILRIGIALVFLHFGFSQISSPDNWANYVPDFLTGKIVGATNIVVMNGIVEVTLALFLITGLYTKFSAGILTMHMIPIIIFVGASSIAVRDFGIFIAIFVVFLNGLDKYTIDNKTLKEQ